MFRRINITYDLTINNHMRRFNLSFDNTMIADSYHRIVIFQRLYTALDTTIYMQPPSKFEIAYNLSFTGN